MGIIERFLPRRDQVNKSMIDRAHMVETGYSSTTKEVVAPRTDFDPQVAARAYQQAPVVHAMVKIVADLSSTVPLNVYMKGRGSDSRPTKKQTGYPYQLLQWVNPRMTPTLLKRWTAAWMMLDGNAYWCIDTTPSKYADRSPMSIYPLNNRFLKIVPDPETGVRAYLYEVNGNKIYIPDEMVIHFRNFNPLNHWYGLGDMAALDFSVQIERFAKRGIRNFFQRGSTIDAMLKTQEDLGSDEIIKLKREFRAQYEGIRNSHRVLVLEKGMEYEPIDSRAADNGISTLLQGPVMDDYAMVFGVPYGIAVGKAENLSDLEFLMWMKTIIPLGDLIDQMLTKAMAQIISERMFIAFDYSNVSALRLHDLDRARVEIAHFNAGLRTANEIRAERLLAPHPVYGPDDELVYGDTPFPEWKARQASLLAEEAAQRQAQIDAQKADPSLSLPGSEGGRDQSGSGEAQFADETGTR